MDMLQPIILILILGLVLRWIEREFRGVRWRI